MGFYVEWGLVYHVIPYSTTADPNMVLKQPNVDLPHGHDIVQECSEAIQD